MGSEQSFGNMISKFEEKHDIGEIPESERIRKPSSLFFIWFGSNLTIGDLALGLLAQSYGMPLFWTLLSVTLGTIAGGVLLSIMSVMGPKAGYPQMIIGRQSFGRAGGSIMAALQWINTTGWLVFNTIIAAFALALLTYTTGSINLAGMPVGLYIIPILIVSAFVFLLAFMGHSLVHTFEKIMSVVIGVLFIYISVKSLQNISVISASAPAALSIQDLTFYFAAVFALSFSYIMSWGPYASDYSRYVSPSAKGSRVFWMTFLGSVLSTLWAELAGIAIFIFTSSFDFSNPAPAIQSFLGPLAYIGLITLVLGGLSANALNLYSNSLSFKTIGFRTNRKVLLVFTTIVAVVFSYFGFLSFYPGYESFLFLLDYWITPWLGVMIADFFLVRRGTFSIRQPAFNRRGILSYLIAVLVSIPFINQYYNTVYSYEGPVAYMLGGTYGADISYFISFFLAMILYSMFFRLGASKSIKTATT